MYRLLQLLHSYRAFLLLLFIELVCIWLLVRNNPYHSAAYFHTSNALIGTLYKARNNVSQYFDLPVINEKLASDNARLRELLSQSQVPIIVESKQDSLENSHIDYNYKYLSAKVINNSTRLMHNFLTINKGSVNGIEPGMGVISANGIVGKVMSVSKNFATVSSLLNTDVFVSSFLKRNNTFCSINWDGRDKLKTKLLFVPKHIGLEEGDTVVTSGYNSVFPKNILIGFIDDYTKNASFYDINVNLSNDFSNLAYVYVIKNPLKEERIELETAIQKENE
ncbi:MAG: rod shape-determining protein MreC [Cyclobacteriaceae bacterium]|nr:rod shape-determining protein MreC [Cyclobacteriaceae bacterium]MCK5468406.1 rod shape-determining protein MreC [Cyclobacteriaceae bacterium]